MDYTQQIDYSSLSEYLNCPRKFLFKYVLHLSSQRPNIDLIFGSCWHYGLEMAYRKIQSIQSGVGSTSEQPQHLSVLDITDISSSAFNKLWKIEGQPHWVDSDIIFPKNPGNASNMYYHYWSRYLAADQENQRILAVESPFTINLSHLSPNAPSYIGRLDLVYQLPNSGLKIVDHKTAKSVGATSYISFCSSLQSDGYLLAGNTYFDKIPTLEYNVALCQKTASDKFERFVVMKRKAALDRFIVELLHYSREIIKNLTILQNDLLLPSKDATIASFNRSPGYACTAYFRQCSFYDLCQMRNNPLLFKDNPPQGYIIKEWNPITHEAEMKQRLGEIE